MILRLKPYLASLCMSILCLHANAQTNADTTAEPIKIAKRPSLTERSTLLANNGHWTMIPKTSAIHVPARYNDKVVTKPTGSLLSWSDFVKKNSGWIHTHEVNMDQARGIATIDEKVMKAYQGLGKIVVSTYKKNPISVKPAALLPAEKNKK